MMDSQNQHVIVCVQLHQQRAQHGSRARSNRRFTALRAAASAHSIRRDCASSLRSNCASVDRTRRRDYLARLALETLVGGPQNGVAGDNLVPAPVRRALRSSRPRIDTTLHRLLTFELSSSWARSHSLRCAEESGKSPTVERATIGSLASRRSSPPRSINLASSAIFGCSKNARIDTGASVASRIRAMMSAASIESPPSARKSSCTPIRSTPSTCSHIEVSVLSVGVLGATNSFWPFDEFECQPIEPKLSGEADALQLPGRTFRKFVQEDDATRHLVLSDPIRGVIPDLDFRRRVSRPKHDRGRHVLAQALIRDRERDRIRDGGMSAEDLVDFARRDFLAPAIDDLLDAPRDEQVAVAIEPSFVARPEPSVDERIAIRFRIVLRSSRSLRDRVARFRRFLRARADFRFRWRP